MALQNRAFFAISTLSLLVGACSAEAGSGRDTGAGATGGNATVNAGGTSVGGSAAGGSGLSGGTGGSSGGSGAATSVGGSSTTTGGTTNDSGGSGAGGSSAGSENGGTGGWMPTVITDCDELPEPGSWEDISPQAFKDPSNMETWAVVLGIQDQRIYAAAGNKTNGGNEGTGALMSTDCGATWTEQTTGTNSDKLLTGDPWAMLIDYGDPETVYMNNGYGADPTLYKSTNAGVDWTQLSPHPTWGVQSHVQAMGMNPYDPEHIAVTFHDTCSTPYHGLCLSYSKDGGDTWHIFDGPEPLNGWQEAATISVLGSSHYLYAANGAWYTSDTGSSWTKVADKTFYASYAGSTALIGDALYLGGGGILLKSTSDPLGSVFTEVAGSQNVTTMISDGTKLYGGNAWNYGGNPMYSASLDNLGTWTQNTTSPAMGRGPYQMAYDPVHHLIYSASIGSGLWRMVTE
jgi:hypothetical protein